MPFGKTRAVRQALERYAGKTLLEAADKNPEVLELGAKRLPVSLCYLDIWGFTEVMSYASPETVVDLLCTYFARMTDVIRGQRGFVDKFFGDAIFCLFGAPKDDPEHPANACLAALAALRETARLAAEWHLKGFGKVHQSIGIVTGPAIVGNVGTQERAMYTAVGPAVSLTVQLQQASRIYRAPIVISRETAATVRERMVIRELDVIKVTGTDRVTPIFELFGTKDETPDHLLELVELFERGLGAFRKRDWERAEKIFQRADRLSGDDGPSRLYLRRCALYRKHPPPAGWDRAHAHTVKLLAPTPEEEVDDGLEG